MRSDELSEWVKGTAGNSVSQIISPSLSVQLLTSVSLRISSFVACPDKGLQTLSVFRGPQWHPLLKTNVSTTEMCLEGMFMDSS
jgi:hypothetical protein